MRPAKAAKGPLHPLKGKQGGERKKEREEEREEKGRGRAREPPKAHQGCWRPGGNQLKPGQMHVSSSFYFYFFAISGDFA